MNYHDCERCSDFDKMLQAFEATLNVADPGAESVGYTQDLLVSILEHVTRSFPYDCIVDRTYWYIEFLRAGADSLFQKKAIEEAFLGSKIVRLPNRIAHQHPPAS